MKDRDDNILDSISHIHRIYEDNASHLMSFEEFIQRRALDENPVACLLVRLAEQERRLESIAALTVAVEAMGDR